MNRTDLINQLSEDINLGDVLVKTIVIQDTIWPLYNEVRCFTSDGGVYAAMYQNDKKLTAFAAVPNKENK